MTSSTSKELFEYQHYLDHLLASVAKKARVPGLSLEVFAKGHRTSANVGVLSVDLGLAMNRGSRFEIGGLSKVFLAAVILEMHARHELNIDDPIARVLPELDTSEVGGRVLIRHLLTHSGGFKSVSFLDDKVRTAYSWGEMIDFLRASPIVFNPGTVFSYTPIAPALLAEIIARLTKMSAIDAIKVRLLEPLKIDVGNSTEPHGPTSKNVISLGVDSRTMSYVRAPRVKLGDFWLKSLTDLTLSTADLVTFAELLMGARVGSPESNRYLSKSTALFLQEQVLNIPFLSAGPASERVSRSVGLGCAEYSPGWVGYNGPYVGQSCALRYHDKEPIAFAIGLNVHLPMICEVISNEVIRTLVGESIPEEHSVDDRSPTAEELVGQYEGLSGGLVIVTAQDHGVTCDLVRSKLRISMSQDKCKRWIVSSNPGPLPIGFFRDPNNDIPCLMIGIEAFSRV